MSEQKSQLIEIGALWNSERKEGVMTGSLGKARLVLLPNTFKQPGEKSPDYRLFVAPRDEQRQETPEPQRQRPGPEAAYRAPQRASAPSQEEFDDEIPF